LLNFLIGFQLSDGDGSYTTNTLEPSLSPRTPSDLNPNNDCYSPVISRTPSPLSIIETSHDNDDHKKDNVHDESSPLPVATDSGIGSSSSSNSESSSSSSYTEISLPSSPTLSPIQPEDLLHQLESISLCLLRKRTSITLDQKFQYAKYIIDHVQYLEQKSHHQHKLSQIGLKGLRFCARNGLPDAMFMLANLYVTGLPGSNESHSPRFDKAFSL